MEPINDITQLLRRHVGGDPEALHQLMPLVYSELHELAQRHMKGERRDGSLEATGLLHEAYLRLVHQNDVSWQDRSHFLAVAARAMRRILVDHARARRSLKRGGEGQRVTLEGIPALAGEKGADHLDLDEALDELAKQDPRRAEVVELRYFGGLTHDEVAEVLEVSLRTVKAEWEVARAWLYRRLVQGRTGAWEP